MLQPWLVVQEPLRGRLRCKPQLHDAYGQLTRLQCRRGLVLVFECRLHHLPVTHRPGRRVKHGQTLFIAGRKPWKRIKGDSTAAQRTLGPRLLANVSQRVCSPRQRCFGSQHMYWLDPSPADQGQTKQGLLHRKLSHDEGAT